MLLAAINRALAPTSKSKIGTWYGETILKRLWRLDENTFTSQRFWDAMSAVSEDLIDKIEHDLVKRIVELTGEDLSALLYDTTNFPTFIHTLNERNSIAQRGNAKSKRFDLRLVGLALIVTQKFGIPLFHKVYAGNINDVTTFQSVSWALAERYRRLSEACEDLTLVFDKGNNSEDNFTILELENIHFVASLVPSHHPDLLTVPLDEFEDLEGEQFAGVRAYRTQKEVFGQLRTVVITFSESFFTQQTQGLVAQLAKCVEKLEALNKRLLAWRKKTRPNGKKPTLASVRRQVLDILSPRHMQDLIAVQMVQTEGLPSIKYQTNRKLLDELVRTLCGKTILFTDQDAWSNEDIVKAYRGQSDIENAFRDMNNWDFLRWEPMFHWTDQKIRVHAFYCVVALTLVSLLRRKALLAEIDLSTHKLLESLSKIYETVVVYPPDKPPAPPRLATVLSRMDSIQRKLYHALDLKAWS